MRGKKCNKKNAESLDCTTAAVKVGHDCQTPHNNCTTNNNNDRDNKCRYRCLFSGRRKNVANTMSACAPTPVETTVTLPHHRRREQSCRFGSIVIELFPLAVMIMLMTSTFVMGIGNFSNRLIQLLTEVAKSRCI